MRARSIKQLKQSACVHALRPPNHFTSAHTVRTCVSPQSKTHTRHGPRAGSGRPPCPRQSRPWRRTHRPLGRHPGPCPGRPGSYGADGAGRARRLLNVNYRALNEARCRSPAQLRRRSEGPARGLGCIALTTLQVRGLCQPWAGGPTVCETRRRPCLITCNDAACSLTPHSLRTAPPSLRTAAPAQCVFTSTRHRGPAPVACAPAVLRAQQARRPLSFAQRAPLSRAPVALPADPLSLRRAVRLYLIEGPRPLRPRRPAPTTCAPRSFNRSACPAVARARLSPRQPALARPRLGQEKLQDSLSLICCSELDCKSIAK